MLCSCYILRWSTAETGREVKEQPWWHLQWSGAVLKPTLTIVAALAESPLLLQLFCCPMVGGQDWSSEGTGTQTELRCTSEYKGLCFCSTSHPEVYFIYFNDTALPLTERIWQLQCWWRCWGWRLSVFCLFCRSGKSQNHLQMQMIRSLYRYSITMPK